MSEHCETCGGSGREMRYLGHGNVTDEPCSMCQRNEELADMDTNQHRRSGKTCTTSNGHPIIWKGHACEGANLTPGSDENFCLWTRCGSADVPAGAAHEGTLSEVECPKCKAMSASQ